MIPPAQPAMVCFPLSLSPSLGASSAVWVFPELARVQGTIPHSAKVNTAQPCWFPEWVLGESAGQLTQLVK